MKIAPIASYLVGIFAFVIKFSLELCIGSCVIVTTKYDLGCTQRVCRDISRDI